MALTVKITVAVWAKFAGSLVAKPLFMHKNADLKKEIDRRRLQ